MWWLFLKPMIMSIVNRILKVFMPRKRRRKHEDE